MVWKTINMNDQVKYKLTDYGRECIVKNHNKLYGKSAHLHRPYFPEVKEDGWYEGQLWCIARDFGEYFSNGGMIPIETYIQIQVEGEATQ